MWLIIILLVITIAVTVALMLEYISENVNLAKWLLSFVIIEAVILTLCVIEINKPQAIDVYRNKTTLEITYKDSIPLDSVVVFK